MHLYFRYYGIALIISIINFIGESFIRQRIHQNKMSTIHKQYGVINDGILKNFKPDDGEEGEDEEDFLKYYPNEPTWGKMFPKISTVTFPTKVTTTLDYTSMKPNDPRFLDMPWPVEAGPEASAFGRHMQWKRSLSDGEREFLYHSEFPLIIDLIFNRNSMAKMGCI